MSGDKEDIMIEQFYKRPLTLRYLRSGVTGPNMDEYAKHIADNGFAYDTGRVKLRGVAHLGHWMVGEGIVLADLNEGVLARFFGHFQACNCVRRNKGDFRHHYAAARCFLAWARAVDLVYTAPTSQPPLPLLIVEFESWMARHRGTVSSTLHDVYRLPLRRLFASLGEEPSTWSADGIRRFIMDLAVSHGCGVAKAAVTPVRMLLRFLAITGRCPPELVDAPPTIARWRLSALPAFISQEDVQRILDSPEIGTRKGLRDRAMLLLMARLGLRAGDVAAMRLPDIDWRNATITVMGKGRRESKLPLPQDVGDAILAWLADARPKSDDDHVFLTVRAPFRGLNKSTPSVMTAHTAARAGVVLPRAGSHVLRHSAATGFLAEGMSLTAISVLLRHASTETTEIYAKVDMGLLGGISRPWPTEVSP
jgi:integrase/recombinase XerD